MLSLSGHIGTKASALVDGQLPEGALLGDDRARLPVEALPLDWERTPRNSLCPCNSGRKFKHCHGALI